MPAGLPKVANAFTVTEAERGATLAAFLKSHLPELSWRKARELVTGNHIRLRGEVWRDPARRLEAGELIEVLAAPSATRNLIAETALRYRDEHLAVVEKPSGLRCVRHKSELRWSNRRLELAPALEDVLPKLLGEPRRHGARRWFVVHRLDKPTSGLIVFARSQQAWEGLVEQFRTHTAQRRYLAVVPGRPASQTVDMRLIRDRGDGLRGVATEPRVGQRAVTHIELTRSLAGHSLLTCTLETGRTHQIRIHLAAIGHPVCGETLYHRDARGERIGPGDDPARDVQPPPRLALHATELGFTHPITGKPLHWVSPLASDLADFVQRLA